MSSLDEAALLARLEKLEAGQAELDKLRTENETLKEQIKIERGMTPQEMEELAAKRRQERLAPSQQGKYLWHLHISPNRKDHKGNRVVYKEPLVVRTTTPEKQEALAVLQRWTGVQGLGFDNVVFKAVGWTPPEQLREPAEPEPILVP